MSQTWDIDTIVPASTSPSADIQKIIDGFSALRSCFSGATEPASADQVAYMLWADTTAGLLKIRNAANSAWITIGTLASANLGLLSLAGGNMAGAVNDVKTTVASATTPDIFAVTVGNTIDYTGTATATGFAAAPQAGCQRTLVCAGASVFTAGANMLIDGVSSGQNFTAAAGDKIHVLAVTTTQYRLQPAKADGTAVISDVRTQDFRLSLTTGVPVTTSDVTAAGTLYAVPCVGNGIALYDGTRWNQRRSAEFSVGLTLTSGKPYDVYCYDNAGVPTLELLVWTNDTTRATALGYQDGVLSKSGATTRRYMGTLYASGANLTEDSVAKRYLWNYYHRRHRHMEMLYTDNTWSYNLATIRQANGNATHRLDYVQGVAEDAISATLLVSVSNSNTGNHSVAGIGIDSTTTFSGLKGRVDQQGGTGLAHASYTGYPGVGRHVLNGNEWGSATVGTITWSGDNAEPLITQSGLYGIIRG